MKSVIQTHYDGKKDSSDNNQIRIKQKCGYIYISQGELRDKFRDGKGWENCNIACVEWKTTKSQKGEWKN